MNDKLGLEHAITQATGRPFHIATLRSVGGGCINDAYHAADDDRAFFVKMNHSSFDEVFEAEATALRELKATGAIRVPETICQYNGNHEAYLVLEYIESSTVAAGDWTTLGRQLAALHTPRQPRFGWTRDNHIGATPQTNTPSDGWIDFFRSRRIEPMLSLCEAKGYSFRNADRLLACIPVYFDDYTPYPSLLHGDLWSGNIAFDPSGAPFVFDPATYYGDRETDIAFTEFFGGFAKPFYDAYHAALPLDPGYAQRRALYNLYHCLNHANLFGYSYAQQAEAMIDRLVKGRC